MINVGGTVFSPDLMEKLQQCSEHKDFKAQYFCKDLECPLREKQPLYCAECMD